MQPEVVLGSSEEGREVTTPLPVVSEDVSASTNPRVGVGTRDEDTGTGRLKSWVGIGSLSPQC